MMAVCLAVDIYIYTIARRRCASAVPSRLQLGSTVALYLLLAVALALPRRSGDDSVLLTIMWILFGFLSVYVSKLMFVVCDLIGCLPKLFKRQRWSWMSKTGGVLAVVSFLLLWWGALVNRFNIQVTEVDLPVSNLPAEFEDFKIVQISDLHTGTYGTDTTYLSKLVGKINSLEPDLIVFTGDIVNRHSSELTPFVNVLSKLDAPFGVYSILGNHDYGDYSEWSDDAAKKADVENLAAMQRQMKWRLLRNETDMIRRGGDSIAIVGVENVGDPPFALYGSLADSYPDLSDGVTKILLSHNPAHWNMEIENNANANVALTLSGHTHAMQMELFGFSPAVFRYRNWGGLYYDNDKSHALYVNIGTGTVGLPMRLGATPEITVLTLSRATK